jgi:hypothetical protein
VIPPLLHYAHCNPERSLSTWLLLVWHRSDITSSTPWACIGRNRYLKVLFISFELEPVAAAQTAWYYRRPKRARAARRAA